jgi:hypothetical protein
MSISSASVFSVAGGSGDGRVVAIGEDDPGALGGESGRDLPAYSGSGAGDERRLAFQAFRHGRTTA